MQLGSTSRLNPRPCDRLGLYLAAAPAADTVAVEAEILAAVLSAVLDAAFIVDARARIVHCNDAAGRLLGQPCEDLAGASLRPFVPAITPTGLSNDQALRKRRESGVRRVDGTLVPAELSLGKLDLGSSPRFLVIVRDITHDRQIQQQIRDGSSRDELTGMLNRRSVLHTGSVELSRAHRYKRPLSVAILDADHFKAVNDTHGHMAGDAVLRHLAATWQGHLRVSDTLGRYGGEEFLLLLPEIDLASAVLVADRLRAETQAAICMFEGTRIPITISAGVAALTEETADLVALIEAADRALYRAKETGRNRVVAAG